MTLKELFPIWAEEKKKQVKISSYSSYVMLYHRYLLPKFGECEDIKEEEVQQWVYELLDREVLAKKSIGDVLICLKMILKFGMKKGLWDYKGFDILFPTSSNRSNKMEVLSKPNYKKLSDYLMENFTFKNIGLLVAMHTGMRIGEICALTWSDIDVINGVISVDKTIQRVYIIEEDGHKHTVLNLDSTKTKASEREIPISKKLLTKFKALKKVVNEDFYVLTNESKPTEPRTYRNYYKEVMRRLDIPPMKFHGLRHTFATYCIEGGADVKTTSVLLGHSNVSITLNTYCHPDMNKKRSVIDKIFK